MKTVATGLLQSRHFQSPGRNECIICRLFVLTSRADLNQIATPAPIFPPVQQVTSQLQPSTVGGGCSSKHADCTATNWDWPFCIVPPRLESIRLDKCLYRQPSPSILTPPCISPNACVMNLPLFLMWDNLPTQAYLRGVVDLFILNTNATFSVIFRAWVGVWDKTPAWWIILWQAGV